MKTPSSPGVSAVLLMGGQSTRMGADKALLLWPDRPLWERQLGVLRALRPDELLISARADHIITAADTRVIWDPAPGLGPLGGLAAAFAATSADWLVVLAVDLPAMTTEYLARLLHTALAQQRGQIPRLGERFEPLAAVYPRGCGALAHDLLASEDRSLQHFVRLASAQAFLSAHSVAPADAPLFLNLNSPADLPPSI